MHIVKDFNSVCANLKTDSTDKICIGLNSNEQQKYKISYLVKVFKAD